MIYVIIEDEHDYDYCHHNIVYAFSSKEKAEAKRLELEDKLALIHKLEEQVNEEMKEFDSLNPRPFRPPYNDKEKYDKYIEEERKILDARYKVYKEKTNLLEKKHSLIKNIMGTVGKYDYYIVEVPSDE